MRIEIEKTIRCELTDDERGPVVWLNNRSHSGRFEVREVIVHVPSDGIVNDLFDVTWVGLPVRNNGERHTAKRHTVNVYLNDVKETL